MLYIAPSSTGGMGVFTDSPLQVGSIIDKSFVRVLTEGDSLVLNSSFLRDYLLHWPENEEAMCMAGFALMFNHSDTPNVGREYFVGEKIILHRALTNIPAGVELFVKYACEPWWDKKPTRPAHKGRYK